MIIPPIPLPPPPATEAWVRIGIRVTAFSTPIFALVGTVQADLGFGIVEFIRIFFFASIIFAGACLVSRGTSQGWKIIAVPLFVQVAAILVFAQTHPSPRPVQAATPPYPSMGVDGP